MLRRRARRQAAPYGAAGGGPYYGGRKRMKQAMAAGAAVINAIAVGAGMKSGSQKKDASKKDLLGAGNRGRKPVSALNSAKIKDLYKLVSADTGTHVDRRRYVTRVVSSANSIAHKATVVSSNTIVESILDNLKYYNPEIPGTLTTAAGKDGTFQKNFLFKTFYIGCTVRNNYQVPCECTLYIVMPKEDTGIAPLTAFTDGLTDVGGPSSSSPLVHITDSPVFNKLYKIVKSKRWVLEPGQQRRLNHSLGEFEYDPSYNDAHSLTYKPINKACVVIARIEGIVAHDSSVTTEYGTAEAGVDYMIDTKAVIKYNAGIDLTQFNITNDSSTFTNSAVISNKPVSDNQAYSVS